MNFSLEWLDRACIYLRTKSCRWWSCGRVRFHNDRNPISGWNELGAPWEFFKIRSSRGHRISMSHGIFSPIVFYRAPWVGHSKWPRFLGTLKIRGQGDLTSSNRASTLHDQCSVRIFKIRSSREYTIDSRSQQHATPYAISAFSAGHILSTPWVEHSKCLILRTLEIRGRKRSHFLERGPISLENRGH